MRILLVGSGGREHALAWKISQSPELEKLWIAPGNAGTALVGENLAISVDDLSALVDFAKQNEVDLVVIGPEGPLVAGLADRLVEAGIRVFGPSSSAAEIEGSKAFCKELLIRHRIPTANYRLYGELNPAISYLEGGARYPVVIKASGLAAGKGVTICEDYRAARLTVKGMLEDKVHGKAGATVLIEDYLEGPEASLLAVTDGRTFMPMEPCQDHKTLLEDDQGPNTGGMGAICPTPELGDRARDTIEREVLLPTLHAMNHEGRRFKGILYAGLKLTSSGPKVLEYNARFGDPECQVLMMRVRSDLVPIMLAVAEGRLEECEAPEWDPRPAVTVVLASKGYPGKYEKGIPIEGLEALDTGDDLQVFHAGTTRCEDRVVTNGGRVLAVTALGADLQAARERAYAAAERIQFDGKVLRTDIGMRGLRAMEAFS